MRKVILTLAAMAFSAGVMAHSGGTNSAGCHTDKKTGVYHCH